MTALLIGIKRATANYRLLILLWLANLLLGLPVALGVFGVVLLTADNRVMGTQLFADKLEAIWYTDLINGRLAEASLTGTLVQTELLLLLLAGLTLLFHLFAAGGIIEVFAAHESQQESAAQVRRFWAGAGAYFGRFMRLFLCALPLYSAVLVGYQLLRRTLLRSEATATAAQSGQLKKLFCLGLLLLGMLVVNTICDYARISTVLRQSRTMWRELQTAAEFVRRNIFATLGLQLLLTLMGIFLWLGFSTARYLIEQNSLLMVSAAFLLSQLAIVARYWSRLALTAAQLDFWQHQDVPEHAPIVVPHGEFSPTAVAARERRAEEDELAPTKAMTGALLLAADDPAITFLAGVESHQPAKLLQFPAPSFNASGDLSGDASGTTLSATTTDAEAEVKSTEQKVEETSADDLNAGEINGAARTAQTVAKSAATPTEEIEETEEGTLHNLSNTQAQRSAAIISTDNQPHQDKV